MQGVPGRAYSKSSPNLSSCQNASDRARKLGRHSATNAHRTCKPSARCRTSERKKSVPVTAAVPWMMARSSSSERLNCAPSFSGTVGFIDWPGLTPRPVDYHQSGGPIKPEKAAVPSPNLTLQPDDADFIDEERNGNGLQAKRRAEHVRGVHRHGK